MSWLTNSWMNNPQYLAQVGHFLGAYSFVLTCTFLSATSYTQEAVSLLAAAGVVFFSAIKEFWYDREYEIPKQTNANDAMDFCFYVFGSAVAVLVVFLHYARVI